MKKLRITLNGKSYEVDVEILKDDDASPMSYMPMAPQPMAVAPQMSVPPPSPVAAAPQKSSAPTGGNTLAAPMNGVVIEVPVKAGDDVKAGQVVVILEAMKMKTNISSDRDGKIASVNISPNDSVEAGQTMLTFV